MPSAPLPVAPPPEAVSRSRYRSASHIPSTASNQVCPTGLIFLEPPRLSQPGWGCPHPQRPLPSLGTTRQQWASISWEKPDPLSSASTSTTFLWGLAAQASATQEETCPAHGCRRSFPGLKMRTGEWHRPPHSLTCLPGSFQKAPWSPWGARGTLGLGRLGLGMTLSRLPWAHCTCCSLKFPARCWETLSPKLLHTGPGQKPQPALRQPTWREAKPISSSPQIAAVCPRPARGALPSPRPRQRT